MLTWYEKAFSPSVCTKSETKSQNVASMGTSYSSRSELSLLTFENKPEICRFGSK